MSHHILEYNGMDVKKILQEEYDRHKSEFERHNKLFWESKSKKQMDKRTKHFHKKFQTQHIAELFGIILDRDSKEKQFKIRQIKQELSIYYENQKDCENKINEKIKELRKLRYGEC
jgi:hypothetical protein